MSVTHKLGWSITDSSGNTTTYQDSVTSDSESDVDLATISIPAVLQAIAWSATLADLQSVALYLSNAGVVETNVIGPFTDLAVDGSNDLKVTSSSHNFVSGDVGSTIVVTTSAGFTPGEYVIQSVSSNAAILNASPAATSTTGGHFHVSQDYIVLAAGQVLLGAAALAGSPLPFRANVTSLSVSVPGASGTATFKLRSISTI